MADSQDDLPARASPRSPALLDGGSETLLAVMNHVSRTGEWEPAAQIRVVAVMGGAKLDFCNAALLEGTTEVEVVAIMGGVTIIVPDDIDLDVRGLPVLGGFPFRQLRSQDPEAPRLRIRGIAVMGGVEMKIRKLG